MSSTPEGKVKRKISALLKTNGAWYTMPIQRGHNKPGVPDYIGVINGTMFGIEAKAGKNKPTRAQEGQLKAIRDAGGLGLVIDEHSVDALGYALTALSSKPKGDPELTALIAALNKVEEEHANEGDSVG